MHASHPRFRALAVGIAAFALLSVAAGGTLAASTNPPTLYACFNTSGQVAMATIPQCKLAGGGQLAYWSTQGVPGPTGATGPTGAMGSTGAQGPAGLVGAATHVVTFGPGGGLTTVFSGSMFEVRVGCDASPTQYFAAYHVDRLSADPITIGTASPYGVSVETETSMGGGGGSEDASTPGTRGMRDLWVMGGGEEFHVYYGVSGLSTPAGCTIIATY